MIFWPGYSYVSCPQLICYPDVWVLKAREMVAMNKPAARDYNSVERYMYEKTPLIQEEGNFIYKTEDLITLRDGREMALLDNLTEKMLQIFDCKWLQACEPFCLDNHLLTRFHDSSYSVLNRTARKRWILICTTTVKVARIVS